MLKNISVVLCRKYYDCLCYSPYRFFMLPITYNTATDGLFSNRYIQKKCPNAQSVSTIPDQNTFLKPSRNHTN